MILIFATLSLICFLVTLNNLRTIERLKTLFGALPEEAIDEVLIEYRLKVVCYFALSISFLYAAFNF